VKTVKVKKDKLIAQIRINMDSHKEEFLKALEGYKNRAIELLEDHIKRIREGKHERVEVILPRPEEHSTEYRQVLAMLEASVEDEIELSHREFCQYWLDEWAWKEEFIRTSTMYS
jgi:hypothetical protein